METQDESSTGHGGGNEDGSEDDEEEGELEIDKILDAHLNALSGRQEHLIRWKADWRRGLVGAGVGAGQSLERIGGLFGSAGS